jgi:FlaG/FlaF family flagellin (archaellin)
VAYSPSKEHERCYMRMKAISPLISGVMIIIIAFALSTLIAPWALEIARQQTNQTGSHAEQQIICRNTAYDFDTNYGTNGVNWTSTGTNDNLTAKIINTGYQNLYNFSFEFVINNTVILRPNVTDATQKTTTNPMEPGQSTFLNTTTNISGTLNEIKILNIVCPSVYARQEF